MTTVTETTPWPKEMDLILALQDVLGARDTIERAILQAQTGSECVDLERLCERIIRGFTQLSSMALRKADRL